MINNRLSFLDLMLKYCPQRKIIYSSTFDKRRGFPFEVLRAPFNHSLIHSKTLIGVGISKLINCARTNSFTTDMLLNGYIVMKEMIAHGLSLQQLRMILQKFTRKHLHKYPNHFSKKDLIFMALHKAKPQDVWLALHKITTPNSHTKTLLPL